MQAGHVEIVNGGECSATIVSKANADKYVDAVFSCANRNVGMPQSWFRTEPGQSLGCLRPEDDLVLQLRGSPGPLVDVLPPEYDANADLHFSHDTVNSGALQIFLG